MIVSYSIFLGFELLRVLSLLDSIEFFMAKVEMNREKWKVPKEVSMELNTWPSQDKSVGLPGPEGKWIHYGGEKKRN